MKIRTLILGTGTLLLAFLFASCSQSPEQNPVIQEKFQKLADLAQEVDQLKGKFKDIENDIDTITQDLTTLKQIPRGTEGASSKDVEALRSQMKQLQGEVSKLQSELARRKKASIAQDTSRPKTSSQVQKKSPVEKKTPTPPPKKRGEYYTVKSGDTWKSIAAKFKTTPDAIRAENRLPKDAKPVAGTKLYIIPGK